MLFFCVWGGGHINFSGSFGFVEVLVVRLQDVRFHWHLWILRAVLDLLPTQVFLLDSVPG